MKIKQLLVITLILISSNVLAMKRNISPEEYEKAMSAAYFKESVATKNPELAKQVIDKVNVSQINTALYDAAKSGNTEMVKTLLNHSKEEEELARNMQNLLDSQEVAYLHFLPKEIIELTLAFKPRNYSISAVEALQVSAKPGISDSMKQFIKDEVSNRK
jgi:hypothetical protein